MLWKYAGALLYTSQFCEHVSQGQPRGTTSNSNDWNILVCLIHDPSEC